MKTADNYKAWEINEHDFPNNGSIEDQIIFLAFYGTLAPSIHNTQLWQFETGGNQLIITANPATMLPQSDPSGRGLQISLGCCVTNILVAAEYFGFRADCTWSLGGIRLTFHKHKVTSANNRLFSAITKRYSAKLPYAHKPLDTTHQKQLLEVDPVGASMLTLLTDPHQVQKTATMQQTAILSFAARRAFFKELSQWLRRSNTKAYDGMPGFVVGASDAQSKIMKTLIRRFKPIVKVMAKKDAQLVADSSAVGFIASKRDSPKEWFDVGRYYETIALEATAMGVVMAPLAALIESPQTRTEVSKMLNLPGKPQFFFRMGYSKHKPYHTPRRNDLVVPFMETQKQLAKVIDVPLEFKQVHLGKYLINYVVAGKGKSVLLLHGANIGWPQWYQNIAELAENFKVYALDLPGAGYSTPVNFHKMEFDEFVTIVDDFVITNKLTDIDVVGSSFGGWIAIQLAIDDKSYVRKVVLANPLGFTTHMPMQFRPVSLRPLAVLMTKTALRPVRSNKNLEKFMRDVFFDKQLPLAPEFIDYFYELSKTSHNLLFISRLSHIKGMRKELYLKSKLSKVRKPVLVIWGKEDTLMPFSTVVDSIKTIPGVKLHTLERVGHMPPVEAPAVFNKLVTDFLKR